MGAWSRLCDVVRPRGQGAVLTGKGEVMLVGWWVRTEWMGW